MTRLLCLSPRRCLPLLACLFLLLNLFALPATAATRHPELRYGGYKTAMALKKAAYRSWISRYGKVACGFGQWSWGQNQSSIWGIPATSEACGGNHVLGVWAITRVCSNSYTLQDNVCVLPEGNVDPGKETGAPEDSLSCSQPGKRAGNPINLAVGNKFQEEVDYWGEGPFPLRFVRTYNSQDGRWRHNYSAHLRIAPDNIVLVAADGKESYFTLENGTATPEPTELGRLSSVEGQWVYSSPQQEQFTFDAEGRLVRWAKDSGEFQTLTYDDFLNLDVVDHLGRRLALTHRTGWDDQDLPLSLTVEGQQITYGYDDQQRLASVTHSREGQSSQRRFQYENTRLTGVIDEQGIRFATWTYDGQGRAISSEHAGGVEKVLVAYNADGSSTVTNELGKQTTYRFQVIEGVKRITAIEGEPSPNCPSSNSTYAYNPRGQVERKTDNKGHVTTYSYNERGQEISRTEAYGTPEARTLTTEWHPTLFLPAKVIEPNRITTYSYDDQGRPLGQSVEAY